MPFDRHALTPEYPSELNIPKKPSVVLDVQPTPIESIDQDDVLDIISNRSGLDKNIVIIDE